MNLFQRTLAHKNQGTPPIWFMRQAGRYHAHYQEMKKRHTFMELCKIPEAACETTLGPIRDFDFDAAILFSDLLFPLEAMGMGLEYSPGPKLGWHLEKPSDLSRLKSGAALVSELEFQKAAMKLIREILPQEKGLLGFVGGPLTLYFYAASGSHQGKLDSALSGMRDGRFEGFCEKLEDLLVANLHLQAEGGPDTIAILDTCAGEIDPDLFRAAVVPALQRVIKKFKAVRPHFPLVYYSKGTDARYWESLRDLDLACLGVDWNVNLAETLDRFGDRYGIQGNIDPHWLFWDWNKLEGAVREVLEPVKKLPPSKRAGWIFGLGHGVMQHTPESNVQKLVQLAREVLR